MDSTLIQDECIDIMAEYAGVGDEVKKITSEVSRMNSLLI